MLGPRGAAGAVQGVPRMQRWQRGSPKGWSSKVLDRRSVDSPEKMMACAGGAARAGSPRHAGSAATGSACGPARVAAGSNGASAGQEGRSLAHRGVGSRRRGAPSGGARAPPAARPRSPPACRAPRPFAHALLPQRDSTSAIGLAGTHSGQSHRHGRVQPCPPARVCQAHESRVCIICSTHAPRAGTAMDARAAALARGLSVWPLRVMRARVSTKPLAAIDLEVELGPVRPSFGRDVRHGTLPRRQRRRCRGG